MVLEFVKHGHIETRSVLVGSEQFEKQHGGLTIDGLQRFLAEFGFAPIDITAVKAIAQELLYRMVHESNQVAGALCNACGMVHRHMKHCKEADAQKAATSLMKDEDVAPEHAAAQWKLRYQLEKKYSDGLRSLRDVQIKVNNELNAKNNALRQERDELASKISSHEGVIREIARDRDELRATVRRLEAELQGFTSPGLRAVICRECREQFKTTSPIATVCAGCAFAGRGALKDVKAVHVAASNGEATQERLDSLDRTSIQTSIRIDKLESRLSDRIEHVVSRVMQLETQRKTPAVVTDRGYDVSRDQWFKAGDIVVRRTPSLGVRVLLEVLWFANTPRGWWAALMSPSGLTLWRIEDIEHAPKVESTPDDGGPCWPDDHPR